MKLFEITIQYHEKLNPKLWDNFKLKDEVKTQLFKIANEFVEFLAIDNSYIKNLILTGSNCNYNWTSNSDLDLHIVIDYDAFQKECNVVDIETLFNDKKSLWNETHDITIYDIPVELYVQSNLKSSSKDGVVYSVMNDSWISYPKKYKDVKIDNEMINKIYNTIKSKIEDCIKSKDKDAINKLKSDISDLRQKALETDGEFATFNLAYKKLRKNKIMQKLWDASIDIQDKELSLG